MNASTTVVVVFPLLLSWGQLQADSVSLSLSLFEMLISVSFLFSSRPCLLTPPHLPYIFFLAQNDCLFFCPPFGVSHRNITCMYGVTEGHRRRQEEEGERERPRFLRNKGKWGEEGGWRKKTATTELRTNEWMSGDVNQSLCELGTPLLKTFTFTLTSSSVSGISLLLHVGVNSLI